MFLLLRRPLNSCEHAEKNRKWIGRNYKRLAYKYEGKWVAVLDAQVINSDRDVRTLVSRFRKKLSCRYPEASIQYVTRKALNMELVI